MILLACTNANPGAEEKFNRSGADWTRQNVWAVLDSYDAREEVSSGE